MAVLVFIVLLIFAIIYISHPILSIIIGFTALITIPTGKNLLEKKLNFSLTKRIQIGSYVTAILILIPLLIHYNQVDVLAEKQQVVEMARQKKQQEMKEEENRKRFDSLNHYLSIYNIQKHSPKKADASLAMASKFLSTVADTIAIEKAWNNRDSVRGEDLLRERKYQLALDHFDKMLAKNGDDPKLLYNRAYCYYKLGKIRSAVADLEKSKNLNYSVANNLYNRINPLKRRVSYYVTRCCDGSTSGASGRGACSWHGGVCNWNAPVYEEYRKY